LNVIDRGHGIPVVLIPGLQGRWEWMAPTIDALARHCRVVTFSLCDEPTSGFPCTPERGIENYVAQIEAAMDRAGLDQAILLGVSYSGPIASEFALRHPDRVRGLVVASALPTDWVPDRRARFYLRAPWLLSPLFLIDAPIRAMPELRAAFPRIADRVRFSAAQVRRVLRAFVSPARMATRIQWNERYQFGDPAKLRMPVLVITGEDGLDRVVPPGATRHYLRDVPGAQHAVLARTGHIGCLTKPSEFADVVGRFTNEIWNDGRRATA
jgi:pimeloyl-ACP methyl ester carboxylesterase